MKTSAILLFLCSSPQPPNRVHNIDQTIFDHETCFPGFDIIRRVRSLNGRYGGGVCTYIRSNPNYKIYVTIREFDCGNDETTIQIYLGEYLV